MKMKKQLLFLLVALLSSVTTLWAQTETTYSPVLDVNFRTGAGNTAWNSGFPKDAAVEGNNDFELTSTAGFFSLQKYTVPNLQNATKLVLTLTVGSKSGVDAVRLWSYSDNAWTAETGIDDIYPKVQEILGVDLRSTEGTPNDPLVRGAKVADSNPAKATWTIQGTALTTIKENAASDGTFTIMLTNDNLTSSSNKRSYLSNNSANDEANRPMLTVTTEATTVLNKTTGVAYKTLSEAVAALGDEDTELEVSADQVLTGRVTWNKAKTLTITPTKDITIKGQPGQMWFLVNVTDGVLNVGSTDYTITLDGENKAYTGKDVTKFENNAKLNLTNIKFQNFDLNNESHLVGSKNNEGFITLENIAVSNCKNPGDAYIYKARVNNDKLILKGFLNFDSDCVGTKIYCASETDSRAGRIKLDDTNFTASTPLTIEWTGEKKEGVIVVIKTTAANAGLFKLTDENWDLVRNPNNGDLVMTAPAQSTAQIGDDTYATLVDALAAAQDGDVITLLDDQEIASRIDIKNKNITIMGDGDGKTIKRAESYKNGLVFLTLAADEGMSTSLALANVTLDGQNFETTAAFIEASNGGETTLRRVTVKNVKTSANGVIVNKSGGALTLRYVTFADCSAAKGDVFVGTNYVRLSGDISMNSIFVEKNLAFSVDEDMETTTPIAIVTDDSRTYGMLVNGGNATQFASESFRLSQQPNGVYTMPKTVAANYSHPALLHTAADIEVAKSRLTEEPYASVYADLENATTGTAAGAVEYLKRMDKTNWEAIYPDYSNFTRAASDAKLAYALALRYQLKGNTATANAALNILNDWAANCKGILRVEGYTNHIADPNEYLILIQAYQFANAAELLSGYADWTAENKAKFNTWMKETFADLAILFLQNHHNTASDANAKHYWMNWDMAALNALMSVGVLTDDKALVDYALDYMDNGNGNGSKANAIVATHQDADTEETLAQCQESGRDQGHATLDVSLLGVLCQTAQNASVDKGLFADYKALEMAEYVGKYNLKKDGGFAYNNVPFAEYTNGEVTHTVISEAARGTERNCWELLHAYAKKNGKADKYTEEWVSYLRAKGGEAATASNDELGFGTLMFGAEVTPTGISNLTPALSEGEGAVYDLQGRTVSGALKPGLYIIGGKKIVKK